MVPNIRVQFSMGTHDEKSLIFIIRLFSINCVLGESKAFERGLKGGATKSDRRSVASHGLEHLDYFESNEEISLVT